MGMDSVWLVRMNGTVIHHVTHPIVVVVGAMDGAVLMDIVLSLHPVVLLLRCEVREAGVGSHWAGQERSDILLSCIDR